jgi:hypothetical protein
MESLMTQEAREPRPAAQRGRSAAEKNTEPVRAPAASGAARSQASPAQRSGYAASQPQRYLVASSERADELSIAGMLSRDAGIRVLRTLAPDRPAQAGYGAAAGVARVAVVEAGPEHAAALAAQPELYVEPDYPLGYGSPQAVPAGPSTVPHSEPITITVTVHDDADRPVESAAVYLLCPGTAVTAATGKDGKAHLSAPREQLEAALLLEVRPRGGHYSSTLVRPRLGEKGPNLIACRRLTSALRDFPERANQSWADRVLGFDRVPPTFRGHGVRVGLIDSGVHDGHPDLADRIGSGRDVLGQDDKSWRQDLLGTGTHSAALLVGDDDGTGIVGLVPEAELHCLRVMPGGYTGDLIEALDYAIAERLDVVQLSVHCTGPSRLLLAKIEQARQAGVACIAAAGDDGAAVPFPANLSQVLTVGAVGLHGTFPPESHQALEASGPSSVEGLFPARFTNAGPEVDVCAPGVSIVSAVPHGGYAALDGTCIAATHVTAVAALVLAHHPMFRDGHGPQGAERVDRLFALIKSSARQPVFGPYGSADPARCGLGIPDAAQCVGGGYGPMAVQPWTTALPLPVPVGYPLG